jgi:integrase
MRRNFTDKLIRSLKAAPPGKRVEYWDAKVPSFGVRVTDRGHKTFILYLRWPGTRWAARREISEVGVLDLEQARKRARDWLAQIQLGIDPLEEIRKRKEANERARDSTFEVVAERWFEFIRGKQRKAAEVETDVRREFVSRWRGRPISEITRAEIYKVIETKALQHPAQARNLLGYSKRIFTWALDKEIIAQSPAQSLRASKIIGERTMRDRVLNDDELRAVWDAALQEGYPYSHLIRLLILTGQRRSELGDGEWGEIDLDKREWIIPASRMKMKKKHLVPLSDDAVAIIRDLPRFRSGEHLFSTTHGIRPVDGFSNAKLRFDKLTGQFDKPWVFHDLRRTVRTNLSRWTFDNGRKIDEEVRERMVAHAQSTIKKTYDLWEYADEKRSGFELWALSLRTKILYPPDSNVVAMRA